LLDDFRKTPLRIFFQKKIWKFFSTNESQLMH
jgi:hypothetical protein